MSTAEVVARAPVRRSGERGRRYEAFLGRVGQALVVAFVVVTATFFMINLVPGDPARQVLGAQATPEAVDALREELRLNEPLLARYGAYVGGVLRGDFGQSIARPNESVLGLMLGGLGHTLILVLITMIFSSIVAVALGIWAGTTRFRAVDGGLRAAMMIGVATPAFFVAAVLILVVAVNLGLAPAAGWSGSYPDRFRYLVLPVLSLALPTICILARAVRERARATMRESFMEAGLARGVTRRRLVLRHVLPNSALPVITLIGLYTGAMLSGAVVVETLFGLPGLGSVILNAVNSRDYPVVQGTAVLAGLIVVLCNLLADAVVRIVDPRTRT